jgi:TolB protein
MKNILLILFLSLFNANLAIALIEVDITRGNLDPLPIAVSPLHVDISSEKVGEIKIKSLGENISSIIENNFKSTGLFNPLKKDAFVQKPDIAHLKPRFEDWRLIKAQALVTGKILVKDGKLKV